MKNKVTFSKPYLKKILVESAKGIEDEVEKQALLSAIEVIFSNKKIVLKSICEACGEPSDNFEIHPHCQEWWV